LEKFEPGKEYIRLPLDAARAIMQASPDKGDEGDSQSPHRFGQFIRANLGKYKLMFPFTSASSDPLIP
jgi:hypothetical protein